MAVLTSSVCPPFGVCTASNCWDDGLNPDSITGSCWTMVWVLIAVGIALIIPTSGVTVADIVSADKALFCKKKNSEKERTKRAPFLVTQRTEDNFVRSAGDPNVVLPGKYEAEYQNTKFTSLSIIFKSAAFASTLLGSLGYALVASAVSSVLWLAVDYEAKCTDATDGILPFKDWVENTSVAFGRILSDYDYYPVFLLVGYVSYVAFRWRDFMVNCHTIQARVHDVALMCGGGLSASSSPSLEIRQQLYRIYRHLNAIHALCYKSVSPCLQSLPVQAFCGELGLLTQEELKVLLPADNKIRDALIALLMSEAASYSKMDGVNCTLNQLQVTIKGLRGSTGRHHDLFIRDNPNLYLNLMFHVVNCAILLILMTYPFSLLVLAPDGFPLLACFQPTVILGVFLLMSTYRTAYATLAILRNPFIFADDQILVDNLLASSDRATFCMLRVMFDEPSEQVFSATDEFNPYLESVVVAEEPNCNSGPRLQDC